MSDTNGRDEAMELAGALQVKVDDIFGENFKLRAENDALRSAFESVATENQSLRRTLEQRTRQRDAAMRTADLLDEKMRQIQAISNEAEAEVHPARVPASDSPALPVNGPTARISTAH